MNDSKIGWSYERCLGLWQVLANSIEIIIFNKKVKAPILQSIQTFLILKQSHYLPKIDNAVKLFWLMNY